MGWPSINASAGSIYLDGKRLRENIQLKPEQVLRVHTRRKRYWHEAELKNRIVEDHDEFLVLDKPGGLPTHPTLDNFRENAKVMLEEELKIPLFTTHRLDVPTQGLLIIAKSADAQRLLNKNFSLGRVEKWYRSINEGQVPLGLYTHFINPETRVPRTIQNEEVQSWWRVQLEVERHGKSPEGFWHEMKLLTGKTHQIRAQMSFMGAPILGDTVYGARETPTSLERIALECFKLSFRFRSSLITVSRPQSIVAPELYD